MNKFSGLLAAALVCLSGAASAEDRYALDVSHTNIVWSSNHFGFSNVLGKFARSEGTLTLDEVTPENSSVKVTIFMDSVNTGLEKFDEHLKGKDFFDVQTYPVATFESTGVELTEAGRRARVTGRLTLHGVTRPLVLDVKLNRLANHPFTQKKTAGFSATAVIRRSDFGITYGLPGVADDVTLVIETEAGKI
jgi:polyisoprenoid-binding protein YceI